MKKLLKILVVLALLAVLFFLGRDKLGIFFYNKGIQAYSSGSYDEAISYFNKSLFINPDVAQAHVNLGSAYMMKKMDSSAQAEYEKALKLDSSNAEAFRSLTQLYAKQLKYEEALSLLDNAQRIIPFDTEIKELTKAVSFEYMANCLDASLDSFMAGDKLKAYGLISRAIELNPDFAFARYTLGFFYFSEKKFDAAVKSLNEAIRIDAKFWPADKLLGDIYFAKGDYELAIANYKLSLSINPEDAAVNNDIGICLMRLERYSEAIPYVKEAVRLEPENLDFRYSLASIYRDNGLLDEAVAKYRELIQVKPDYQNVHNDLADIYLRQKNLPGAAEEYNKEIDYCNALLSVNPNDRVALNNLAYALNGLGDHEQAKNIIKKLLGQDPNYRQAYLTLSRIYEDSGVSSEAIAQLNKARSLAPAEAGFIEKDIGRIQGHLKAMAEGAFYAPDTVYLKNGRMIHGRIMEEDAGKIILQVGLGTQIGSITFYKEAVDKIIRANQ